MAKRTKRWKRKKGKKGGAKEIKNNRPNFRAGHRIEQVKK